jgi:hypothetical protein
VKRAILLAAFAAAACSPRPRRPFALGFLAPVSPRVADAARRAGLEIAAQAPAGAAAVSAAVPRAGGGGEVTADWSRLRFLTARAIAEGSSGIFLRLPKTPAGRDYLEYVEESQSVDRVLRELLSMRPILQGGEPAAAPFPVPAGMELRAWTYQGRRYVLLVNPTGAPLPLQQRSLEPWRALFAVRADAREVLNACGPDRCLSPNGTLWLEGRLLPEL